MKDNDHYERLKSAVVSLNPFDGLPVSPPSPSLPAGTDSRTSPPSLPPTPLIQIYNIASLYCNKYGVRPEQFVTSVFWRTLYARTWLFGLFIFLMAPGTFESDKDFIKQVGFVQTMQEYQEVENCFRRGFSHQSSLRSSLRLRVSTRRVRRIVQELLAVTMQPERGPRFP
jgi:hypothetical protein